MALWRVYGLGLKDAMEMDLEELYGWLKRAQEAESQQGQEDA